MQGVVKPQLVSQHYLWSTTFFEFGHHVFSFAETCLLHLPDSCGCATQAQNNYTRSVAAHLLDFGIGLDQTDTKVSMDIGRRMGLPCKFDFSWVVVLPGSMGVVSQILLRKS